MKKTKLTIEEVKHVAKLANLPLSEDELEKFGEQLSETLNFINHLEEIPTKNISETFQITGKTNELREDIIVPGLSQDQALKNAKSHNGYFVATVVWD